MKKLFKHQITNAIVIAFTVILGFFVFANVTNINSIRGIYDYSREALGAAGVQDAVGELDAIYASAYQANIIGIVMMIVIVGGSFALAIWRIINPLSQIAKATSECLEHVEAGNFTDLAQIKVGRMDEIGITSTTINKLILTIQNFVLQIKSNTKVLSGTAAVVESTVQDATSGAEDISAAMQELAASMEEISSTVVSVIADTNSVEDSVNEMGAQSQEVRENVSEIQNRSETVKQSAETAKQQTVTVISEINEELQVAIDNSKHVDSITQLASEILNISSKTNLLALNASIEAARAGDAGRGFSVVAEEIRILADSSKTTATSIQEFASVVTQAVERLVVSSNRLMEYVNTNILPDYDARIADSDQYTRDTENIRRTMEVFSERVTELNSLVHGMIESFNGISAVIEQDTVGIGQAAESTSSLAIQMQEVASATGQNKAATEELRATVER